MVSARQDPLPPGSTIGILGAGQLGRMLALAAARLGLKAHIFADESGPAFDVAAATSVGMYRDRSALSRFSRRVDVVTYEFENVPVDTAAYLAELRPVRPGPNALATAQDRLAEKEFISRLDIQVADFAEINSPDDLARALARRAAPSILKSRRLGYDGKGQVELKSGADVAATWSSIGGRPAILEQVVAFAYEVSVLVVRGVDGALAYYDIPMNTHENGILRSSRVPSDLPKNERWHAREIAAKIAESLDYVGVLAVEMFYLGPGPGDRLMVNEIAPRVHNSGHWTIDACAASQFENHIRAVAGWPLGSTERHSDAEMVNLIGKDAQEWVKHAAEPLTCLHLYGKREAREGRKMGHVTRLRSVTSATPKELMPV
ncbi:MAG TPA: 5-(carboxyamino)imidazole ribonucleotide synthase [Hyphomicrobiaceae bacterium]|nr:5-(carboxyamino)imidazole ribonucleotide synthase [Hyphomicrobiaceae bacterium]